MTWTQTEWRGVNALRGSGETRGVVASWERNDGATITVTLVAHPDNGDDSRRYAVSVSGDIDGSGGTVGNRPDAERHARTLMSAESEPSDLLS